VADRNLSDVWAQVWQPYQSTCIRGMRSTLAFSFDNAILQNHTGRKHLGGSSQCWPFSGAHVLR